MSESLGFETKQEERDRLSERFNEIKVAAYKNQKLSETNFDFIDRVYSEAIRFIYSVYKLGNQADINMFRQEIDSMANLYIAEKRQNEQNNKIGNEMLQNYKLCNETVDLLLTKSDLNVKEQFILIFELIGLQLDNRVSAAKILINAGIAICYGQRLNTEEKLTIMEDIKRSLSGEDMAKFPVFSEAENILLHEKENEDLRSDET
ncbi:MAG: hypothetical protein ACI4W6_04185 [Acutalibacteraceae bacterium]